jgi:hypothetical protein
LPFALGLFGFALAVGFRGFRPVWLEALAPAGLDHRFALGDRLVQGLYDLLEGLVAERYATSKLERLEPLNARLDLLRLQIRLLHNFQLIDDRRYEHVACLVE